MFEELGLEGWSPLQASLVFGVVLGAVFGFLAQRSGFCLRRALVGNPAERSSAAATWLVALAVAIAGTTAVVSSGMIDFGAHRFHATNVPVLAVILGGLLFGAGMVLTRGCASRLTVLAATGNLRAVIVMVLFAVTAYATIKGILAPLRVGLGGYGVDFGAPATLSQLAGGPIVPATVLVLALLAAAAWHRAPVSAYIFGVLIGALVPLGWLGTGYLLFDEFDPIGMESLAFTSSLGDTLFWTVAGTAIEPGFGVGLVGGVLLGSFLAAIAFGDFKVVGFTRETPTGIYIVGGLMMGFGGVLAGGCTIGAGLSGVATLSLSAILALAAIIAGAYLADALGRRRVGGLAGGLVPAE